MESLTIPASVSNVPMAIRVRRALFRVRVAYVFFALLVAFATREVLFYITSLTAFACNIIGLEVLAVVILFFIVVECLRKLQETWSNYDNQVVPYVPESTVVRQQAENTHDEQAHVV
jgi:hypothetical protein